MRYCYVSARCVLSDTDRMSLKEFDLHVTDPNDIINKWGANNSQAILNTN